MAGTAREASGWAAAVRGEARRGAARSGSLALPCRPLCVQVRRWVRGSAVVALRLRLMLRRWLVNPTAGSAKEICPGSFFLLLIYY